MPCCQCEGIEQEFNRKRAQRFLRRYLKRGPAKTTRMLLEGIHQHLDQPFTVLDIGGGVGVIPSELLNNGATRAEFVEASSAFLEIAAQEFARRNLADRVNLHHGDFLDVAESIPPADVVTLERVICCYPNMEELVRTSAAKARKVYALVYPRYVSWLKFLIRLANLYFRLRNSNFRVYLHDPARVNRILEENGWRTQYHRETFIWLVTVYTHRKPVS